MVFQWSVVDIALPRMEPTLPEGRQLDAILELFVRNENFSSTRMLQICMLPLEISARRAKYALLLPGQYAPFHTQYLDSLP